jgi:hypothetical protein
LFRGVNIVLPFRGAPDRDILIKSKPRLGAG